jgi:hypothetical protein
VPGKKRGSRRLGVKLIGAQARVSTTARISRTEEAQVTPEEIKEAEDVEAYFRTLQNLRDVDACARVFWDGEHAKETAKMRKELYELRPLN